MISSPLALRSKAIRNNSGVALLITLAIVVIISIIVMGLAASLRLDRAASASSWERLRATAAAEAGITDVVSTLIANTSDTERSWASQPGRIILGSKTDDATTTVDERKIPTQSQPLTSGVPSSSAASFGVLAPAKLNLATYNSTDGHLVSNSSTDTMKLRWIYIRQDGTTDTSETPDQTNKTNPIVSRYAYWADDDSTKLNLNLAWKRNQSSASTSYPPDHPSHVDLGGLSNSASDTLTDAIKDSFQNRVNQNPGIPFNNIADAKQLGDAFVTFIDYNKFHITHFNSSPTPNSDPIYLTTDINLMNALLAKGLIKEVRDSSTSDSRGPNFIDILGTAGNDTSYLDAANLYLSRTKLNKIIAIIRKQLIRTDWPQASGKSLIEKWYGAGYLAAVQQQLADQVAMNIIDYVRLKETKVPLVPPVSATQITVGTYTFSSLRAGTTMPLYLGATSISHGSGWLHNVTTSQWLLPGRAPLITEMAMVVSTTSISRSQAGVTGGYWPEKATDPSSGDVRQGATATEVNLYPCKIYVEVYLPPYPGMDSNFQIDMGATGSAAWPQSLPPEDVFAHTPSGAKALETYGKWFLGFPDEINTWPANLLLDTSKAANTAGASTDGRNHITYYTTNEAKDTFNALTYGTPYTNTSTQYPLGLINHAPPMIRSTEFIGGRSGAVLKPGQRIVIAKELFCTASATQKTSVKMRVCLSFGSPATFSVQLSQAPSAPTSAPMAVAMAPLWDSISIPIQSVSKSDYDNNVVTNLKSLQIDDPKLGYFPSTQQWKWTPQTFGSENSNSEIGQSPSNIAPKAQQDTDVNGKVTSYSVFFGSSTLSANDANRVRTSAELGVIHTGMANQESALVPWRTLRLQPDQYTAGTQVPDWVLLDVFAAPPTLTVSNLYPTLVTPHNTSLGGKVNINSCFYPSGLTSEKRITALQGLLIGAHKNSSDIFSFSEATDVATNIASQLLATGSNFGKDYGYNLGHPTETTRLCDTPSQIVEIKGIADRGEESEETVKDILKLATTSSNTFTVYTIGQSLLQGVDGSLSISAEKRRMVTLELYTTATATTTVKIRTVYSSDLTP
jgi:hypothetical protein